MTEVKVEVEADVHVGGGSGSTASAGQPIPQYPGSVANPANQYLFNV